MNQYLYAAACAVALAGLIEGPADAVPLSGLENIGQPVPDDALADMRGKFVAPSGISYFGIQMASSWQGSDGITTSAMLMFSIDFSHADGSSGSAVPQMLISWSRDCAQCGDSAMDVSGFGPSANNGYVALGANGVAIPVGALNSATGVVQSQQIAGSDNQSHNGMTIEIVPASAITSPPAGMTALTQQGSESHQFDDGDILQFNYASHQLGLTLTDQNGALQQGVDGTLGQLAQHVLIAGSDVVASNSMNLMIGMDAAAGAQRLSIQNALATMKGQGF